MREMQLGRSAEGGAAKEDEPREERERRGIVTRGWDARRVGCLSVGRRPQAGWLHTDHRCDRRMGQAYEVETPHVDGGRDTVCVRDEHLAVGEVEEGV